jgi:phosphomannomutase
MINVVLFDMDGTLTPARQAMPEPVLHKLEELAAYATIGIVSGSPLQYIQEQCPELFKCEEHPWTANLVIMPCNGTQKYLYANGAWSEAFSLDMRQELGDKLYDLLIAELTHFQYLHSLKSLALREHPLTGHFISYRQSMVNWCPVGRSASDEDRAAFKKADERYHFRQKYLEMIERVSDLPQRLSFSMGGHTSIDVYPHGWDKTYALNHFPEDSSFWFVGDRCLVDNGNDKSLYEKLNLLVPGRGYQTDGPNQTLGIIDKIIEEVK